MPVHKDMEIGGVPVLARSEAVGPSGRPVVVVVHGMRTTAETLKTGWPDVDDGLDRVYWRLPVLREGVEAMGRRRDSDPFRDLFAPVVSQSRAELAALIQALGPRPIGLFGFSIGGLVALWGAADLAAVRAVVSVGAVPSLEYLVGFFPDYDWEAADVAAERARHDLSRQLELLAPKATCILHGEADTGASWSLMAETASRLQAMDPERHPYELFPHVQHRLTGETPEEEESLGRLRERASSFLRAELTKA